jgi:hypothetical protein
MNRIVPTARADRLPALCDPEVDRKLYDLVSRWEGGSGIGSGTPVLRRQFSADEQSILERRVCDLSCAVAPFQDGNRNTLIREIAGMFAGFPAMQRHDEATALGIAAGYLWTVRDRPHWAIAKACAVVRSGEATLNRSYAPSEPEFAALIEIAETVHCMNKTDKAFRLIVLRRPREQDLFEDN